MLGVNPNSLVMPGGIPLSLRPEPLPPFPRRPRQCVPPFPKAHSMSTYARSSAFLCRSALYRSLSSCGPPRGSTALAPGAGHGHAIYGRAHRPPDRRCRPPLHGLEICPEPRLARPPASISRCCTIFGNVCSPLTPPTVPGHLPDRVQSARMDQGARHPTDRVRRLQRRRLFVRSTALNACWKPLRLSQSTQRGRPAVGAGVGTARVV